MEKPMPTPIITPGRRVLAGAACALLLGPTLAAQSLGLQQRDAVALPGTATDQHGAPFTITGLSGVSALGGGAFACVMDNSDKLVFLDVSVDAAGLITSATVSGGLKLEHVRDYEGIAFTGTGGDSVFLAEEGTPGVHEYALADGAHRGSVATPPVFANILSNRGFESLARGCASGEMWTGNEEALTVDGAAATPTQGTTVRLLRIDAAGQAAEQYAYEVEPMHGINLPGGEGQSGLAELVALPDGTLLALERSLALASPLFESRVYRIDFTGATEISGIPALLGATYTPVAKELLWSGSLTNLEGLTLGPQLGGNRWSLLGVVDDGDPLSSNFLVSFELSGPGLDACACATSNFCSTSPHSAGSGALISAWGGTNIGANDFTLLVSGAVPGTSGLFYYGPEPVNLPFGEGVRCVGDGGTGVFRLGPPAVADAQGDALRVVDFTAPPMNAGPGQITAGSTWYFQYWFRDPQGGPSGFNLSDGFEARFCP